MSERAGVTCAAELRAPEVIRLFGLDLWLNEKICNALGLQSCN
jgi:hypothetical protein